MKEINEIKKAYSEILSVCDKYVSEPYLKDYYFRDIRDMKEKAENHLTIIEWQEKYGLEIEHDKQISGRNWCKIDDYRSFSYFANAEQEKKNGSGRYISWEGNDKQPKDEWLLSICFSTGAYIFGDDYPKELFQEFWQELKTYNPKYCDSHNNNLYFSMENSSKVFNNFDSILQKYWDKNKEDAKVRKIKKMKEELEKLEQPTTP